MKTHFTLIHPNAAGIDIGGNAIFIDAGLDAVKRFGTFTEDFHAALDYLQQAGIQTVVMEATGVYWVVLYDILDRAGMDVWVVNGWAVKQVPGRKTDVQDCQWLRQLHSYGLIRKSFIPNKYIRELRSYMRLREVHIQSASREINHMHKALVLMNVKLGNVINSLSSKSGIRVVEAILSGERNAATLADLCDIQIKRHKLEEVKSSLIGNYQQEHLFALRQAYQAWIFFEQQVTDCDAEIEKVLQKLNCQKAKHQEAASPAKIQKHHKLQINNLHEQILLLTDGSDVTRLPGITDYNTLRILAETGSDLSHWPTEKHFVSWLGLAPTLNSSGNTTKKKSIHKTTSAGQIFREAAQSLLISKYNALGAFGRRIRSRKGPFIAIKALARKLACMFYKVLTKGWQFVELGISEYKRKYEEVLLKNLNKQAKALKCQLVPVNPEVHW